MILSYDLITFQILGQKSVKFFGGFLENLKFQNDILKLSDLYLGITDKEAENTFLVTEVAQR